MQLLHKTKKRFTYAIALALGSLATIFMISKDNSQNNDSVSDYQIINKANADIPYSQSYYQSYYQSSYGGSGGGADHDDGGSGDGGGSSGGGGGVSDEYT